MHFVGCAGFFVRDVLWYQSDANSVQNRLVKVRSVQFACLIEPTVSSFSSVRGTVAKSLRAVLSVQFTNSSGPALEVRKGKVALHHAAPQKYGKTSGMLPRHHLISQRYRHAFWFWYTLFGHKNLFPM